MRTKIIRNALNKVNQPEANLATIIATNRMTLFLVIRRANKVPHHRFAKLDGTLFIFYTPGGFNVAFGLNGAFNLILFTSVFAGETSGQQFTSNHGNRSN